MGRCFVIQPFDKGGAFDKRYADVFVPAIEGAGLEPYRVDKDPSATILIEVIEENIRNSEACLADISADNPNVWYELGYAFAAGRPVVMVASESSKGFPFDVRHRKIITYLTESMQDFQMLQDQIKEHLLAAIRKGQDLQRMSQMTQVKSTSGLSAHEASALSIAFENGINGRAATAYEIKRDMRQAGYTDLATSLSIESLLRKGLVSSESERDENGEYYNLYPVAKTGVDWLLENQDKLLLRVPVKSDLDAPF